MKVLIHTPTPQFANDMADEIRVFFGAIELCVNEGEGDCALTHHERVENGLRICEISVCGAFEDTCTTTAPVSDDALVDKRLHKRQIKLAVYDLMKRMSGRTPPWGSLTGIRPTRILYALMEEGATLDEAAARAQALYDVQDEKIDLLKKIITVQSALPAIKENEIDIYAGIPFCVSRCAYCSFLAGEVGSGKQLAPYVEALEHEIARTKELIDEKGLRVRALYVGGGTPTALPPELLSRVMKALRPFMEQAVENTVEAGRPDTITREKLQILLDANVQRISVNPQTKHDETLQTIGRKHTSLQTEQAYALAREMGFHHINMDLIAGLPGENYDMFLETLHWALDMHPESLTVHTLSIKHASLLHRWQASLPDGSMVAKMVRAGADQTEKCGLVPYYLYRQKYMAGNLENVGYALPDHACLYNVGMMEETQSVIALGAGAVSKRVAQNGRYIARAFNMRDVREYILRVDEMVERKRELFTEKIIKNNEEEGTI